MACDRCDEYRGKAKFCPQCGESLKDNGLPYILFILGMIIAVICSIIIIFEYGVALWGSSDVIAHLEDFSYSLFVVVPWIVDFITMSGTALQIYYVLLIVAVGACILFLFYKALKPAAEFVKGDSEPIKHTALYEMTILFCALYIVQFVFIVILQSFGVDISTLSDRETWNWMFSLLNASVWEEIVTRVLYLGLPVLIIYAITKKNDVPLWRYLFGGFEMNKMVFVFVIFSAFMFGAGHLNNWDSWKFFTTFLFGLIAGYLFVRYGLYATITMHFMTDYLQAGEWLTGSTSSLVLMGVIMLMTSLISIPYVYVYSKKGIDYVRTEFGRSE